MPFSDAERWDVRYSLAERYSFELPRPFLVENACLLPSTGLALDAAMGLGGNAAFLIQRGLQVIGIDISRVALHRARQRLPSLRAVRADLTNFYIPPRSFDLIINFFYLERSLWPVFEKALKPGGILVYETLLQGMRNIQPDIDPTYLLEPQELLQAFPHLEILAYREGWIESDNHHLKSVAGLIARA